MAEKKKKTHDIDEPTVGELWHIIRPLPDVLYLKCPSCGGIFHQTSSEFYLDGVYNGSMFELRRQYGPSGENWSSFPQTPDIMGDNLTCPGCDAPYVDITRNLYLDSMAVTMTISRYLLDTWQKQSPEKTFPDATTENDFLEADSQDGDENSSDQDQDQDQKFDDDMTDDGPAPEKGKKRGRGRPPKKSSSQGER
jgi:hypothetical protein